MCNNVHSNGIQKNIVCEFSNKSCPYASFANSNTRTQNGSFIETVAFGIRKSSETLTDYAVSIQLISPPKYSICYSRWKLSTILNIATIAVGIEPQNVPSTSDICCFGDNSTLISVFGLTEIELKDNKYFEMQYAACWSGCMVIFSALMM